MGKRVLMIDYCYPGLVKGLQDIGWEVLAGDQRNWSAWCHGNIAEVPKATPQQYGQYLRDQVRQHKPDLLWIGKGLDSNIPALCEPPWWHLLPEDIEYARSMGALAMMATLDDPDGWGWGTASGIPRVCDSIGTCCIGTREYYARHTQADVFEFWPAWDQVLRQPPPRDPQVDLVVVGTPYLKPNGDFGLPRRDVVRAALELGLSVEVYGPNWLSTEHGGDPALEPHYRGLAAWSELHRVLARGRMTYNSFLRQGFRYLNDRVPIAAGAGTFLVMEEQLGLEGEFREGSMVGYHKRGDLADLKAALARWAGDPARREQAATAMQRHVLAHHTYAHRAKTIDAAYAQSLRRVEAGRRTCCGQAKAQN